MLNVDRITFDPKIMAGQACIRGMRVPVSLVLNLLTNGKTTEDIIADYPYLEVEDIQQSLVYGAWLAREQYYPKANKLAG
ncbi:DUF433 domain-containing protein [Pleurocapsa sp. FMAR1]|uniref:DUF433 domain-containing protein n=1 Tax=Pleurocapsa sp. FMAR1 TaxID=3040204 RepID=UPI0029C639C4|nr:DUF433 domain-containing protein [Pleurocapsa sp. FMAR1]